MSYNVSTLTESIFVSVKWRINWLISQQINGMTSKYINGTCSDCASSAFINASQQKTTPKNTNEHLGKSSPNNKTCHHAFFSVRSVSNPALNLCKTFSILKFKDALEEKFTLKQNSHRIHGSALFHWTVRARFMNMHLSLKDRNQRAKTSPGAPSLTVNRELCLWAL